MPSASAETNCHSWAEAYVPGLGWVGFDPVNNLCPQDGHVRCAAALDALGAAFIRTTLPKSITHRLVVTAMA